MADELPHAVIKEPSGVGVAEYLSWHATWPEAQAEARRLEEATGERYGAYTPPVPPVGPASKSD